MTTIKLFVSGKLLYWEMLSCFEVRKIASKSHGGLSTPSFPISGRSFSFSMKKPPFSCIKSPLNAITHTSWTNTSRMKSGLFLGSQILWVMGNFIHKTLYRFPGTVFTVCVILCNAFSFWLQITSVLGFDGIPGTCVWLVLLDAAFALSFSRISSSAVQCRFRDPVPEEGLLGFGRNGAGITLCIWVRVVLKEGSNWQ